MPESIPRDESIIPAAAHPGEQLRETLSLRGITAYRLSKATGIPQQRHGRILQCELGVSADTAIRLGLALGTTHEVWLGLQCAHDLNQAAARLGRGGRDAG